MSRLQFSDPTPYHGSAPGSSSSLLAYVPGRSSLIASTSEPRSSTILSTIRQTSVVQQKIITTQLEERVVKLEKTVNKLKAKMSNVTEDIYDYVEDTVEAVEHAMLNQERKFDKYQGKVRDVENAVGQLQSWTAYRYLPATFRVYLHSVLEYIFSVLPLAPKGPYPV
jgi:uncharacterized coiled-coil protein SlyX